MPWVDKTLPIELNAMEVLHLESSIENGDISEGLPDEEAYKPQGRDLLLRIGGAFNELITIDSRGNLVMSDRTVRLWVTEEQVWTIRSKVSSTTLGIDNQTNIGIPLLRKCYDLLLRFHSGVDDEPVTEVEEPPRDQVKSMLREWEHANADTD